jgi:ATPase family AAA domain-containing protein 3A/B
MMQPTGRLAARAMGCYMLRWLLLACVAMPAAPQDASSAVAAAAARAAAARGVRSPSVPTQRFRLTDDFSGREIEKLFVAVQSIAYGSGCTLDAATLLTVVQAKRDEHAHKAAMNDGASIRSAPNTPRSNLATSPAANSPGRRRK